MNLESKKLGDQIRSKRVLYHMSRKDLSTLLGVSEATVGAFENGESTPRADTLYTMCIAFNTSPNDLFGWSKC